MKEICEKEGKITDLIFRSEESGYTVAILKTDEESFSIVGNMHTCNKGASYKLRGEFVVHQRYGRQFSFSDYEETMPTTEAGIEDFLASGSIKGIGPKMAAKIVSEFGEEALTVLSEAPEKLMKINGIGPKTVEEISASFAFQKELADIAVFLRQYGVSVSFSKKLYDIFGEDTIDEIKANPYIIVREEIGAGFKMADDLAYKMGVEKDDAHRIANGLKYVLEQFTYEGNTFIPIGELLEKTAEFLDVQISLSEEGLEKLEMDGDIKVDILEDRQVAYLWRYYLAEISCGRILSEMISAEPKILSDDVINLLNATEARTGVKYSKEQKTAILGGVSNSVSIITGGPGTGKTTIINGILDILSAADMKVAIAAPTGRAAKRITETTGYEASTIHRLLEYSGNPDSEWMNFNRNMDNPLEHDVVVIDEASMIDLLLMQGLLEAMKGGARLIIVGDVDQLPPVGAGNVLRDIISSEAASCFKLKEIFRQAAESMIVVNAHRINNGEYPDVNQKDKDFFMMESHNENNMVETIKELCSHRLPDYYDEIDAFTDIQILTPGRKRIVGSINLNRELQEVMNPPSPDKEEKVHGGRIFREGDKVMQIKNNYEMEWRKAESFEEGSGIFNGDMGVIDKIDKEFNEVTVLFDGDKYVKYEGGALEELEIAYAITVHKSQGSEFPIIVMPISWFPPMLATRNLLYTAVTRGKTAVILVGSVGRLCGMVDNVYDMHRYSGLDVRLKKLCFEG